MMKSIDILHHYILHHYPLPLCPPLVHLCPPDLIHVISVSDLSYFHHSSTSMIVLSIEHKP